MSLFQAYSERGTVQEAAMDDGNTTLVLGTVSTPKGNVLVQISPAVLPPIADTKAKEGEVRIPRREDVEPVGRMPDLAEPIADLGGAIEAITSEIISRLRAAGPNECSIELKVGFAGEAKVPFIASGKADGAITLKLTWKDLK